MSDSTVRSLRGRFRLIPGTKGLPSSSRRRYVVAILLAAAIGAGFLIESKFTTTAVTTRNVGIGQKIAILGNGTPMSLVLSTLGAPDHQKTVGEYTQWMYGEIKLVESRTRVDSGIPGLALENKHEVRQEGTNYVLFFRGDTLVARPPREWEWHVLYRRLNPPGPFPPYPLAGGSDLHTALSQVVDRRTTLAELESLLGKPWRVLCKDNLQVPYFRVDTRGGCIYIYVFVKDGIVIWTNYSVSETEADEADRLPFYDFGSWPDYRRLMEDQMAGRP